MHRTLRTTRATVHYQLSRKKGISTHENWLPHSRSSSKRTTSMMTTSNPFHVIRNDETTALCPAESNHQQPAQTADLVDSSSQRQQLDNAAPQAINAVIEMQERALVWYNEGRYKDAADGFHRAWQQGEAMDIAAKGLTARAAHGLAMTYFAQKKYLNANSWFRYAREGCEDVLEWDHTSVVDYLLGEVDAARLLYRSQRAIL